MNVMAKDFIWSQNDLNYFRANVQKVQIKSHHSGQVEVKSQAYQSKSQAKSQVI